MGNMYIKNTGTFYIYKSSIKKSDFNNFLFKLNLYVFSLRFKESENWKNDIYIFLNSFSKD